MVCSLFECFFFYFFYCVLDIDPTSSISSNHLELHSNIDDPLLNAEKFREEKQSPDEDEHRSAPLIVEVESTQEKIVHETPSSDTSLS